MFSKFVFYSSKEIAKISILIQVEKAHSWTCMDLYIFATPYRVTWDYYFISREHTLEFEEWEGKAEYEYVSYQLLFISN